MIKEIFLHISSYLKLNDQIRFAQINKQFYNYVNNFHKNILNLIRTIDNWDITTIDFDCQYKNLVHNLFTEYNQGKVHDIEYVYWRKISEVIGKLKPDKEVTGVYLDYLDRGVRDWKELDVLLRKKFPNLQSIHVSQNFGEDNLADSKCEFVILNTMDEYEVSRDDIIYQEALIGPDYYNPEEITLTLIQTQTQYQLIITVEPLKIT